MGPRGKACPGLVQSAGCGGMLQVHGMCAHPPATLLAAWRRHRACWAPGTGALRKAQGRVSCCHPAPLQNHVGGEPPHLLREGLLCPSSQDALTEYAHLLMAAAVALASALLTLRSRWLSILLGTARAQAAHRLHLPSGSSGQQGAAPGVPGWPSLPRLPTRLACPGTAGACAHCQPASLVAFSLRPGNVSKSPHALGHRPCPPSPRLCLQPPVRSCL